MLEDVWYTVNRFQVPYCERWTKMKNGRKTIMADNEERNTEEVEEAGDCDLAPNGKCIKGYKQGWRPSKECRFCRGKDYLDWPDI